MLHRKREDINKRESPYHRLLHHCRSQREIPCKRVMDICGSQEGFEAMVRAAESNPAIAIQYKMVDQWKEIAGEQVKAFEHMNLGNITVFDGGNGGTSNFLNTLVKTVAPSLGVLDKLPIGETVKGIINPESKTEEKPATKADEKKDKK